ncbi:hypothetical protein [Halolamina sp.]|jgi:hypothetical protein|uniref:hypothetical protein n=1 Tax=Halolamina sp. TaxID=1940283 RepID=UPI000223BE59|nr:hypothetical protein Halar_3293 [halophilic archaeon DL31]
MKVRDAVEGDVPALAALVDAPPSVLRNLVHERSVRILVDDDDDASWVGEETPGADATAEGIHGVLSFDVRDGAVHVTRFGGNRSAAERLLAEPLRFARSEGLPIEALVGETDDELRAALEAVGFEQDGSGPVFGGDQTDRYRFAQD